MPTAATISPTTWATSRRSISSPSSPARYDVKREMYQGVANPIAIEVYYIAVAHLRRRRHDRRIQGGSCLLRKEFQPLPVPQYRILEFPRYRTFAQSFPNTVPFSEGIGFIGRVEKPTDIDFTYFVTAHELGHQWWAHQLIGGRVEGSNMMSETLAEYSALMVMQQKYGRDNMHRFLKHELDRYLRGRGGEIRRERAAGPGPERAVRLVSEGRPGDVHAGRLHRRRQSQPRPAQLPDAVPLRQRQRTSQSGPTPTRASSSKPCAPKPPPICSTTSPTPSRTSFSTTTRPTPPPSRPPPTTNTKSR